MDTLESTFTDGNEVDMQEVLTSLEKELGPARGKSLYEAIRRGDEDGIRENLSIQLDGPSTLLPKEGAILAGRPDLLKLLLERHGLIEEALVITACERKDRHSIRTLLDFGWPINRPLCFMPSLLCSAVDDIEFMQWLIKNGADVNARSELDESVLSIAVARGSMEVVRFLLAQGTDVTHGDLLHYAAQRKNQWEGADLVEDLVQRGADVNAYRYDNPAAFRWRAPFKLPTPLHVACRKGNVPVAEALLKHGADPLRKMCEAGKLKRPTPLEYALKSNDQRLIDLLTATS